MRDFKAIERAGTEAVKQLRVNTLKNGNTFMINSKDLPSGECYLEYPDGRISLATLSPSRRDFHIIRDLTSNEAMALRKKYNLSEIHA